MRGDAAEASLVKQSEATLEGSLLSGSFPQPSDRNILSIGASILRSQRGILNSNEVTVSRQTQRYLFGQGFLARMNLETKHTWENRSINMNASACRRQAERFYQMTNTNIREA